MPFFVYWLHKWPHPITIIDRRQFFVAKNAIPFRLSPNEYPMIVLPLYLLLLVAINAICIVGWKRYTAAERTLSILLGITLISESGSVYLAYQHKNNQFISHIFSPLEFFLISLYFNYGINYFRKKKLGIVIGGVGIALSILNTLFLQKIDTLNSYFLLFEGMTIIIYCLLALHQVFLNEEESPYKCIFFWIAFNMMLFWSVTYTGWGIDSFFDWKPGNSGLSAFSKVLRITGFAYYIGLCIVFLRYPKLNPTSHA